MDGTLAAGRAALQAGNVFAAVRAAKEALQDDPQDIEALDLLYDAHMFEHDYLSAQDVLPSWLRISPNDPDAHFNQTMLQMTLGRQDDAKARIDQFATNFPTCVHHTMMLQGIWEEAFGSPDKSVELYEEMLTLEPNSPGIKIRLAMAHVNGRNAIAANALMRDVVSQYANDADALRTLAVTELKAFQLGNARRLADAARAANPRDMAMKKVKWLSWLVFFPPFAVGHALQMILSRIRFSAGNVAANIFAGLIGAAMVGALIYARETQNDGGDLPLQISIILASGFLAGCWALSMYYIFGIGNADDDKRTASLTGGY